MDRTGRKLLAVLLTAAACGSGALVAPAIGSPLTRGTSPHRSARGHRHCAVHARRAHHGTHPAVRCGSTHHTAAKQPAGPQGSTPTATSSQPASTTPGETPPAKKPPEVPRIQVTAVEYHYTLSRMTVPAGKVILEFVDKGMDEHN